LRQVISDLDLGPLSKNPMPMAAAAAPAATPVVAPVFTSTMSTDAVVSEPKFSMDSGESGWAARFSSMFGESRAKTIGAVVGAVIAGAVLVGGYVWMSKPSAPQPDTTVATSTAAESAPVGPAPSSSAVVQPAPASPRVAGNAKPEQVAPAPTDQPNTVTVGPGQTLAGICIKKFGVWTPEMLRQIRALNPNLGDMDHIEVGQTIRVPNFPAQGSGRQ
jgi:hypothetical protein